MRIISWNIRQGGGSRTNAIIDQLQNWSPDIVALSEFRGTAASVTIASALNDSGFSHQVTTTDDANPAQNGLLMASKCPFKVHSIQGLLEERGYWIHIEIEKPYPLHLINLHVPNRDSGIKYDIHAEVVNQFRELNNVPALAFGDTNSGVPDFDEQAKFFNKKEGNWFHEIQKAGWDDTWRKRTPQRKEYTWHNHNGNGFRLDQLFASDEGEQLVKDVHYDWGLPAVGKLRGPSDHAAIVIDLK